MNSLFKKSIPYLFAVLVFLTIGGIYMSPVLDGKMIVASDGVNARAANRETMKYHEDTGEYSWWIGSMFSGMPAYQIGGGEYASSAWLRPLGRIFYWGHRNPMAIVVIYCIAFFILLSAMRINKWLAMVGSIAIAFSSYFFIIIAATHNTKTSTLALMAVVVAGFYLIYNGRRWLGVALTMLFTAYGMYPHPQMAYYMCFVIGFFFLAELWIHIKAKRMKDFGIATALFVASFAIGAGTGTAATFANAEYASETMRGGHSDLVKTSDKESKTAGLDLDYATQWSYGKAESFTFLIPNFMGGSSNYNVGETSDLYKTMVKAGVDKRTAKSFSQNVPTYWGEQPFTSGPVYMGAVICFLFVLGLMLVKGPYKWALLVVTLFSVCLSWGNNWMWLTRLFFDIFPLYNKFRAVSSILVIAEITMPILGFLALRQIVEGKVAKSQVQRSVYVAGGVTGGICLFFALFGSGLFTFVSSGDARMFSQLPDWLSDAIVAERESLFTADCWRSLLFVVLTATLLWIYNRVQMKTGWLAVALGILVLADMWPVDKRFMNDGSFSKPSAIKDAYTMQPYEKQILQDKDPHFRVFNLAANTFNDARTSYYLKSIGGYSAAKLRRYQDLIDEHLSKMNMNVVNMLNAKYIIIKDKNGNIVPQRNPDAMGNAWFVDSLVVVNTANEESDALNTLNLRTTAVLDKTFADFTTGFVAGHDSTAVVRLTKYTPEYIEYTSQAAKAGTIVFSEIYYPYGWKAYVDGEPVEHYRVDYMLRALNIKAGEHHIRFEFRPDSVTKGNIVSMICVVLMALTIVTVAVRGILKLKAKQA